MLTDDCHRSKSRSKGQRPNISHKDRRWVRIEPEKAKAGPQDRCRKNSQLSRSLNVRNQEILRHQSVTGHVGDHGIGQCSDHHGPNGQPIEPVREIDGIGTSDDHNDGKNHVEPSQVRHEALKKRHAEFCAVPWQEIEHQCHTKCHGNLCAKFLRCREPFRSSFDEFEIIIDKPDGTEAERRTQHQPDMRARDVRPQQRGKRHGEDDQDTAHCRGPTFGKMSLGSVITYLLPQLNLLEFSDHPRREDKCNQKCGDCGVNDAKALIAKDIQEGELCMQRVEPDIQHKNDCPLRCLLRHSRGALECIRDEL